MPRARSAVPKYQKHKASGRAKVRILGVDHWLGQYGTKESRDAYAKLIASFVAGEAVPTIKIEKAAKTTGLTVTQAMVAFWKWAENRYAVSAGDGRALTNLRLALRSMARLHGDTPLHLFGPSCLIQIRDQMAQEKLARRTINARIGTIKRFVKWTVSRELAPPSVLVAVQAVESLRFGEGGKETAGRRTPVTPELIEGTIPHLPPMVQALVRVLWLTGARVGEIRKLTTGMIDRSTPVWKATLVEHKTAAYGKPRIILLGPSCQEIIEPWLRPESPDEPIFSPKLIDERLNVPGRKLPPGETYHRVSLARCLRRAIARAFPHPELLKLQQLDPGPKQDHLVREWKLANKKKLDAWIKEHTWSLAQLRHNRATELREEHGIDVAATILGHARPDMTTHYSREAIKHAEKAVKMTG